MAKAQKISAGEKTAKVAGGYSTRNQIIAGIFLISSIFLTWFLSRNKKADSGNLQNIKEQTIDSGSINNYNAKGDINIENNTFNNVDPKNNPTNKKDTLLTNIKPSTPNQKKDAQINVTSNNQSGGQTANQINNNY